jgi:membrane-bound ClpP family serine protease
MELSTWGVGLIILMFGLFFVELFLPTGGVLGIVGTVAGIAGVVVLFRYDMAWGFSGLLAVIVLSPAFAAFAFKVWPHTPMGRRIIGAPTDEEVEATMMAQKTERERIASMVGREGLVLTALRPVGVVEINGERHDALAETTYIQPGRKVRVVYADGSQMKVREV